MPKLKCWKKQGRNWVNEKRNRRVWIERGGVIVFGKNNNILKILSAKSEEQANSKAQKYMKDHDRC